MSEHLVAHMDSGGEVLLLIPDGQSAAGYAANLCGDPSHLPAWLAIGNAERGFVGWVSQGRIEALEIKSS